MRGADNRPAHASGLAGLGTIKLAGELLDLSTTHRPHRNYHAVPATGAYFWAMLATEQPKGKAE